MEKRFYAEAVDCCNDSDKAAQSMPRPLIYIIALLAVVAIPVWFVTEAVSVRRSAIPLDTAVGATRLRIPAGYVREGVESGGGVEVAAHFPDFRPLAGEPRSQDAADIILLRFQMPDPQLDPGDRMARLYARFLEPDRWTHPGGLIAQHFEKGSPYEREELYYTPPEGRLFAARCTRPIQPPDGLPDTCMSDIRIGGLDIRIRFSPERLSDWEQILGGVRGVTEMVTR